MEGNRQRPKRAYLEEGSLTKYHCISMVHCKDQGLDQCEYCEWIHERTSVENSRRCIGIRKRIAET